MEPQHPPTKIARFADLGFNGVTGGWSSDSWNMETNLSNGGGGEGSSSIGLGLELGSGFAGNRPTSSYKTTKSCGFTIFQMQELHLQSLIYKYMEAGLPVPSYLVVPIWKSVASSFSGLTAGGLHQLYPGFLGSGGLHLEFKNAMDPEPGRCRRTDGKKWRCSKDAVPDHKYCERHLHRGRPRSRKLVEAASNSASTTTTSGNHTNTNLSISLPAVNI